MMPRAWKTLYLPNNFPKTQALRNYVFGHNETHMGLVLDYGSLLNHHESPNIKPGKEFKESELVHFKVSIGFQYVRRNTAKICGLHGSMHVCAHTQQRHVHITHFQGHKRHGSWTGNFGSVW